MLKHYTLSNSVCPISGYALVGSSSGLTVTDDSSTASDSSKKIVAPTDRSVEANYTFSIQVTMTGGGTFTDGTFILRTGCSYINAFSFSANITGPHTK